MTSRSTSLYLHENTEKRLESREGVSSSRSYIINRDLRRLYIQYERALRKTDLKLNEALLIIDALNGTMTEEWWYRDTMYWEIEDAINLFKMDQKWNVDKESLLAKINSLSDFDCMAVADAAERYWVRQEQDIPEDDKEALKIFFKIS